MSTKNTMPFDQQEVLAPTRVPLRQARHLPGDIYTSPELFEREKETIFMRHWICLARVEEIGEPGDYMTFRIMGESVIAARNDEGEINTFANVCRHRGVEVASGLGNTRRFSCPYHGWTYDLEGKLLGAPYMKEAEGFEPSACRLQPIHSHLWGGWIFINFAAQPPVFGDFPVFDDFIGEFEREFGLLRQEDLLTGDKIVTELSCNWKLVVENLMDFYHAKTLHGATFGAFVDMDLDVAPFTRLQNGGFSIFYSSAPMLPGGVAPMGKIPWLEGQPDSFSCMGLLPPTVMLFGHCDNVQAFITWPLTPDTSRLEIYTLFSRDHVERPDFAEHVEKYHDFMSQVVDEDREMVQSMQRNLGSRLFEPGRMSRHEENIHNTINGYLEHVFGGSTHSHQ